MKLILALYVVDSGSWIAFLQKERKILAANYSMKSNFFTFFF